MSAFLGPIHTWLYKKIKFQDQMTCEIIRKAEEMGYVQNLEDQIDKRFGALEQGDLADIIDESNIHGWLQERVSLVEKRLAYTVMILLYGHEERNEFIRNTCFEFGKKHSAPAEITVAQAYKLLEDLLLNGMPCDMVNRVEIEEEDRILWSQTVDIHEKYWEMTQGNVADFYELRSALIEGLFEGTDVTFTDLGGWQYQIAMR